MVESQQKLVRGIETQTEFANQTEVVRVGMKFIYEFWGFSINGGSSLTTPGATLAQSFPSNFESGTSLIASGTAGSTNFDSSGVFFASDTSWSTTTHVDKYLVTWNPNEPSSDDSIYRIRSVIDESSINVDNFQGGGTIRLGNKPTFSTRSDIHYRVVDIESVGGLAGWADGQGMIMSFSGSSDVNEDQLNSQAHLLLRSSQLRIAIVVSPSGSWNGSSFSDASSEINPGSDFASFATSTMFYYLAGSRDHLIFFMNTAETDNGSGIHVEIPRRLYPKEFDPNPIVFMTFGEKVVDWTSTSLTYGTAMNMISHNGTTQNYSTAVRNPWSKNTEFIETGPLWNQDGVSSIFVAPNRYNQFSQNKINNLLLSSDVTLYSNNSGQFSLSRVRLRKVRAAHGKMKRGTRHGRSFIHISNGVLWPWDNAIVPLGSFWQGVT